MWPKSMKIKQAFFYYPVEDVCCPFSSLSQPWASSVRVSTICLCLKQLKHQIKQKQTIGLMGRKATQREGH